jgi:hypothetical protein
MKMGGTLTHRSGWNGIITTSTLTRPKPSAAARSRQH